MAECTVSWVSLSLCEAIKRATSTLTPTDKPINKLTNRLTTEDVEPTAAIERGPEKYSVFKFVQHLFLSH